MARGTIKTDIRRNLKKIANDSEQDSNLDDVVSKVLNDLDLNLYMEMHTKGEGGLIVDRMDYFDDGDVQVPYGISYNFNNDNLDVFTFEFVPGFPKRQIPYRTLDRSNALPKGNGHFDYSDYPTPEKFLKSLDNLFQYNEERINNFWANFNEPFYR